jgi:hypothetical protein
MDAGGRVDVAAAGLVPDSCTAGTLGRVDNDGVGVAGGVLVADVVAVADADGGTVVGPGTTVADDVGTEEIGGVGGVDGTAVGTGSVGSGTAAAAWPPAPGQANPPAHKIIATAITRVPRRRTACSVRLVMSTTRPLRYRCPTAVAAGAARPDFDAQDASEHASRRDPRAAAGHLRQRRPRASGGCCCP